MEAKPTVLVLGATGPAGICLLRELLYRQYKTVAYARNPSKIPEDVCANRLLTVIKGEMNDHASLSQAIALSSLVISLLGPDIANKDISPTLYPDQYKDTFPLLQKAGVKRILAMGTISISRPEDHWNFFHTMVRGFMKYLANNIYQNMLNIAALFDKEATELELDWTVFRLAQIPGGSEEQEWKRDREEKVFAGPVGAKGWTSSIKRGALAKWLVDNMESETWSYQMPSLSRQA